MHAASQHPNIRPLPLEGALVLTPPASARADGTSLVWAADWLPQTGDFVQANQSVSAAVGTLRGMHYQAPPQAQGKLVRCERGEIFDVIVDARRSSPTFGQHCGVSLTAQNRQQLWVPPGFLHGFVTRTPDCEVVYKCTAAYSPVLDGSVRWDSLGIDWGLNGQMPVLSAKDAAAPAFDDWLSPFG